MSRLPSRTLRLLVLPSVLLVGLGAALVISDISDRRRHLEDEYRLASEVLALTFSRAARTALIRGETEFLQSAARMILAGDGELVQIVIGEDTVLCERSSEFMGTLATLELDDVEAYGVYDRLAGRRLLDVIRPLASSDPDPVVIGYVRILFDPSPLVPLIRVRALVDSGIALASVGGLLIGLWFLFGRRKGASDWLKCGAIDVSRSRKLVRIFDVEMILTPKQFELLAKLASEPGRVFSDTELIEAVWPTSAYANSSDVKQCIYTLRKRLGEAVVDPHALVETVTGHGYRLVSPGPDQRLKPI